MKKMISTGNCATGMCIQGCILGDRWLQIGALVYLYRPLKMKRRSLILGLPETCPQYLFLAFTIKIIKGTELFQAALANCGANRKN